MNIEILSEQNNMQEYVDRAWDMVANLQIDMAGMSVDHVGVRIPWGPNGEGDYSNYLSAKQYFEASGATLEAEAIIPMTTAGRPIAIYKLKTPMQTKGGEVQYVEVPAPRIGREEVAKLDHIEIVLPEDVSLAMFIAQNKHTLEKYTDQDLNKVSLSEPNSVNPDVTLNLGEGVVVKFHTKDIGYVVTVEQQVPEIAVLQKELRESFEENASGVINE